MKKLDSNQDKESLQEEVKRLRKENKKLASQKDKLKAKYDKTQKELKKRRSEDNIDRRTKSITLEPVPGHRFPLIVIQLCVLIYMCTPCGLRKVVTIQGHHWLQAYTSCRHQSFHGCDSTSLNLLLASIRAKSHRTNCTV